MNLSALFREYLLNQSNPASKVTVKNYLSDVNRFLIWYEFKTNSLFDPNQVSESLLSTYKSESLSKYSASSVDRNLSSLRKFFAFLKLEGIISQNPFEAKSHSIRENEMDSWHIRDFKNYLYVLNASNLTIKNYIIDVKQFKNWLENSTIQDNGGQIEASYLLSQIDSKLIDDYKYRLLNIMHLSPVSVNRKLSSLRRYFSWASEQGLIKPNTQVLNDSRLKTAVFIPATAETIDEPKEEESEAYSGFPPVRLAQKSRRGVGLLADALIIVPLASAFNRISHASWVARGKPVFENSADAFGFTGNEIPVEAVKNLPKSFYAPTEISIANFPTHRKIWHKTRYSRPNWYIKYHSYPFMNYLHLGVLMIAVMGLAYILIINLDTSRRNDVVLGNVTLDSPRLLSYQGRITDEKGNPINETKNLRMSIYRSESATGSALLWQEVISATPNRNGVFDVVLGKNTPIPGELFSDNPSLFLGITVETTNELAPRQQIPTVDFSENSKSIQGLVPITKTNQTSNVILTLNSSGNLSIGGRASPVFQATGGSFTLSGQTLILSTNPESNGNIILSPNGTGIVDIQKAIQNTSNDNSIAQGAVKIDDLLWITATSAGQAALTLNQTLTGDLLSAASGQAVKFRVDNGGNIFSNGSFNGLGVTGGSITTGAWTAGLIATTYGGTGLNTSASTGVPFVSNGTWSIDSNSLAANHGGTGITSFATGDLLYANTSNSLAKLSIGGNGSCLVSNGSLPAWSSCSSAPVISSKWTSINGAFFPDNATQDFLIGGNSTSSAKFAVINLSSGSYATATLSGNLIVMPINGSGGNSGFGTVNPEARVQISGGGLCVGNDTDCNIDNNSEGVIYAASTNTTVYDVAENYPTKDTSLTAGEVVAMDPERGIFVARNTKAYNPMAIGAISEAPGLLLGGFNGAQFREEKQVPVALSGRIIIKASNENGPIRQGDFVTSASSPGKVMRATRPGPVIGQALEDWNENDAGVMVFIKATSFDPHSYVASLNEVKLSQADGNSFEVVLNGEAVEKIGVYSGLVVAGIKAGYLELGKLTVETATIVAGIFGSISTDALAVTSENLTIAGVNIRDYINSILDERIYGEKIAIISPILETDMIKPGRNLTVKLSSNDESTKLEITNASGSAVASIDAAGNVYAEGNVNARSASFSGTLASNELQTNDASVSGTLRAGRIIADEVELSEEVLARLQGIEISGSTSAVTNNYISNNYYYSSASASPADSSLASATNDVGSLTVGVGTFTNGLVSFGPTSFYEVSVADKLYVGAQLSIAGRSINVLGANLELQPLRLGGVSIAGGLVEIDTDGNLKVDGNALFAKDVIINSRLFAGIISAVPGKGLIFDFNNSNGGDNRIEFRSGTGSAVLSFNYKGDINASGAGTFNKLNLSFIPKAQAVSDTEVIATGSAGTAEIKSYKNEVTIKNPLVTADSLIYITPKVNTPNQSVYLLRQVPEDPEKAGIEGSFTVGLSKAIEKEVPFNWILIN